MGAEGFQATVGTRWLCSGFPWGRHFPQPAAPAVFTRILRRTGVCSFVWGCWPIGRRGDCRRQYRLWKTGGRSRSGGLGGIRTCRDGRLVHTGPAAMRRLGNLGPQFGGIEPGKADGNAPRCTARLNISAARRSTSGAARSPFRRTESGSRRIRSWGMSGNGVKNYSKRARWSRNR